ncbi:hypothetical protein AB0L13_30165 [Saccharopolyspora shandongensis]|uniref:hypothetical protein n=1 Tax=Saccharopolyspora shandongensis TaxID=418495 RepID=UPI00342BD270
MNSNQIELYGYLESSRELTARAVRDAEINRALREGGRLSPWWLDRFANWWASVTAALRPGAAVDPGPAPRGCLN